MCNHLEWFIYSSCFILNKSISNYSTIFREILCFKTNLFSITIRFKLIISYILSTNSTSSNSNITTCNRNSLFFSCNSIGRKREYSYSTIYRSFRKRYLNTTNIINSSQNFSFKNICRTFFNFCSS